MPDAATVSVLCCTTCGALDPGPRDLCARCHTATLVPHEIPGDGVLVSWTMIRRPPAAFKADGPYAVAIVKLDVGVQVTGRLASPENEPAPGTRVRAVGRVHDSSLFNTA